VLRRMCGLKGEEGTRDWRRLYYEELRYLVRFIKYCKVEQMKEDEMGGACSTNER